MKSRKISILQFLANDVYLYNFVIMFYIEIATEYEVCTCDRWFERDRTCDMP